MATACVIGYETVGGSYDNGGTSGTNVLRTCKFTISAPVKVSQIKVYFVNVSGSYNCYTRCGIYEDDSGYPGNKIANSETNTINVKTFGWNAFDCTSAVELSAGTYWLMANCYVSTTTIGRMSYDAGSSNQFYRKEGSYGGSSPTIPDLFPSGSTGYAYRASIGGWGIFLLKPSGLSQPLAYGTPTVQTAALIIYPPGLEVVIAYGTPTLIYPQTMSPPGLAVTIGYGTPSVGVVGYIYVPGHQQPIAYGMPTILKYVWHVILGGSYITESPETNRAYVIGRDQYGNPVFGSAVDSIELGLVGERLDFQQELAIPTTAQAGAMADAILSKIRLTGKSGVILIPPNCGQELFDVVEINDSKGNQSAVKFRVVGIRFEYSPRQARYYHKLTLGAP